MTITYIRPHTLKEIDETILAAVARAMVQDPHKERTDTWSDRDAIAMAAVRSVLETAGVPEEDFQVSEETRRAVRSAITDELLERSTTGARGAQVTMRRAQRGDIKLSQFKLQWPQAWDSVFTKCGMRKQDVIEAIASPTKLEMFAHRETTFLALLQEVGGRSFQLVVHGWLRGDIFSIFGAWRFPSDLYASLRVGEPFEVLEVFANAFGVPFQLPNRPTRTFVRDDTLAVDPGGDPLAVMRMFRIIGPQPKEVSFVGAIRRSELTTTQVTMAFYLDVERYQTALRERGLLR